MVFMFISRKTSFNLIQEVNAKKISERFNYLKINLTSVIKMS